MFDLSNPPADFAVNPFPYYDELLRDSPVTPQPDGSFLICNHADLNAIYRDTALYISDKKQAFAPRFGPGSPLFEHHTTSLVFNDPPLHTRVRRDHDRRPRAQGNCPDGARINRRHRRIIR